MFTKPAIVWGPHCTYTILWDNFSGDLFTRLFHSFVGNWLVSRHQYGGFHSHVDTPKWLIFKGNPFKMDDLGVPLFQETSILPFIFWLPVGLLFLRTSHLNSESLIPFHSHDSVFFSGLLEIKNSRTQSSTISEAFAPILSTCCALTRLSAGKSLARKVVWDMLGCAKSILK